MKGKITAAALICLLLCGCSASTADHSSTAQPTVSTKTAAPAVTPVVRPTAAPTVSLPQFNNTLYYLTDDYDDDGRDESFVVTGDSDDSMGFYTDVDIYFVDSSGKSTKLQSDIWGTLQTTVDTGTEKYFIWEETAGGSASASLLYTVKNNKPYQPEISGKYMMFRKQGVKYVALVSDFSSGFHDYLEVEFDYNSKAMEFTLK